MGNDITEVPIVRIKGDERYSLQDPVVREFFLTIF